MSSVNLMAREVGAKIVFYGPGLSGKTTTLRKIYETVRPALRGEMMSLATEGDRTLFFDFLPVKVEKVGDCTVRLALYTVPGQVFYNATHKLVLQGADGVVFVADSQPDAVERNRESLQNLEDNLLEQGLRLDRFPLVIQYNKRDVEGVLPVEELREQLNPRGVPDFETCAISGRGVLDGLKAITRLVINDLRDKRIVPSARSTPVAGRTPIPHPEAPGFGPRPPREGLSALGDQLEETGPRPSPALRPPRPSPLLTPSAGQNVVRPSGSRPLVKEPVSGSGPLASPLPPGSRLAPPLTGQRPLGPVSALAPSALLDHALAAEAAFAEGRREAAVAACREGVRRALAYAGGGEDERTQAWALGLEGRDVLRLQRLSTEGHPRLDDAAFALYVFAQALVRLSAAGLPDSEG